jgi:general secretion pathway protein G
MIMISRKLLWNLLTDFALPNIRFRDEKQRLPLTKNAPKSNGFTLTEMLVTLFILGLVTTIVVINVLPNQDKAMVAKAKADISTLAQAMESYRLDNMTYPSASEGLQALVSPPPAAGGGAARPGYIKRLPDDPWGRPYQYANPGRNGGFDVYSLGADGAPGGENDNADIYSD